MRYNTFDLEISAAGAPREYLISAKSSSQGEAPLCKIQIDTGSAPLSDLLPKFEQETLSSPDLHSLGMMLYQALFVGEIHSLFNRALGETLGREDLGLRLRLRINPPELSVLPWEMLYSSERRLFLAASLETPLSRYLNLPEPIRVLACPQPVRVLVVIPQNSDLDTAAEREMLEQITARLRDKIVMDFLPETAGRGLVTGAAIRTALRERDYHLFHYAGHGSFKDEHAVLYLDHEAKMVEPVPAEQFAHFFTDCAFTRLVFLNACKGAARSAYQALAGAAPQLVLRGVPAVVAMQNFINNDDAILFATEFYNELCNARTGGQVEAAISRSRKALLQERPGRAVFATPVLYLRAPEGRLWENVVGGEVQPVPPVKKEEKSFWERWQTRLGVILGILTIIGWFLDLPEKMSKLKVSKEEAPKEEMATTYLRGQVTNLAGEPVAGATITLEELSVDTMLTTTTTSDGGFYFEKVPGKIGERGRVYVKAQGYKSQNEYVVLPGPKRFKLETAK